MSCEQVKVALPVYLDGELTPSETLEVERHLRGCASCAEIVRTERAFRAAFRDGSLRFEAPAGLSERVRGALRAKAHVAGDRGAPRVWLAVAASFVVGVVLTAAVIRLGFLPSYDRALAADVLASHLRSLLAGHLTDVPSADQHTVKPWFAGKLDFSPSVPDLADEGFLMVGGRLDYLAERPVAAIVYRRRQHVINLFTWPSASGIRHEPATGTENGYHLLRWASSGMNYWAVSDVDLGELERFERLFQSRTP